MFACMRAQASYPTKAVSQRWILAVRPQAHPGGDSTSVTSLRITDGLDLEQDQMLAVFLGRLSGRVVPPSSARVGEHLAHLLPGDRNRAAGNGQPPPSLGHVVVTF